MIWKGRNDGVSGVDCARHHAVASPCRHHRAEVETSRALIASLFDGVTPFLSVQFLAAFRVCRVVNGNDGSCRDIRPSSAARSLIACASRAVPDRQFRVQEQWRPRRTRSSSSSGKTMRLRLERARSIRSAWKEGGNSLGASGVPRPHPEFCASGSSGWEIELATCEATAEESNTLRRELRADSAAIKNLDLAFNKFGRRLRYRKLR